MFKEKKPKKIDSLNDIEAIIEFLEDVKTDQETLIKNFKSLQELEKESHVTNKDIIKVNLDAQSKLFDKIIENYEFFQNDVDINGIRVKMLAKNFLKKAKKAELDNIVKEKKKSMLWKFQW